MHIPAVSSPWELFEPFSTVQLFVAYPSYKKSQHNGNDKAYRRLFTFLSMRKNQMLVKDKKFISLQHSDNMDFEN